MSAKATSSPENYLFQRWSGPSAVLLGSGFAFIVAGLAITGINAILLVLGCSPQACVYGLNAVAAWRTPIIVNLVIGLVIIGLGFLWVLFAYVRRRREQR
jgi:hypothetical protein